jgi:hypothetical protein
MAAIETAWDDVTRRLVNLERHPSLRPTIAAMHKLIAKLRNEPWLNTIEPGLSLASLSFRRPESVRLVMVSWRGDMTFRVSFVDPPLEFSEQKEVGEADIISTIRHYVDQLGPTRDSVT